MPLRTSSTSIEYSKYGWKVTALCTQNVSKAITRRQRSTYARSVPQRATDGTAHHDLVVQVAEVAEHPLASRKLSHLLFVGDRVNVDFAWKVEETRQSEKPLGQKKDHPQAYLFRCARSE